MIDTDMTRDLGGGAQDEWAARIPMKRLGRPRTSPRRCLSGVRRGSVYYGTRARVNGGMYM
jgi:hypothetical protein